MPSTTPSVRVVVRLPWNRPEQPPKDPPRIEWTTEKADILWKVIELSRSSDNGGTDWKGLAAHLEVPLPYLLYRVHRRFQEELRGLQDIQVVLGPTSQPDTKASEAFPVTEQPPVVRKAASRMAGSSRLSLSSHLSTPLAVRARLSSLGQHSPRPKKASSSSSTLTVQGVRKTPVWLHPTSPTSEDGSDSDDEAALKEEEADKNAEEQEALERKLKDLQNMMTNDALGLVSTSRPKDTGKTVDRGQMGITIPKTLQESFKRDTLSSQSNSQSVSSTTSSRPNSIPDIPSPLPGSQPHSPVGRQFSSSKSSSPPAVSPRSALGQSHLRYGPRVGRGVSEQDSNQGSEASSFSDISDASLSASALESALLSNIRGNGSRFSAFGRSRFVGRGGGVHH